MALSSDASPPVSQAEARICRNNLFDFGGWFFYTIYFKKHLTFVVTYIILLVSRNRFYYTY